jgi:MoaA/NifB/PqqE/SkfB family radical SAM enzyme
MIGFGMSPELQSQYDEAAKPFWQGGGAISIAETRMKSWRYFLEINSACNLRCPSCTKGNQDETNGLKYEHKTGLMDPELMERIIDKIASENPNALVMLYGNSEPFLHPRLPECIAAVKRRGLRCEFSTNLNHIHRVDETLAAGPDMIIISLSGFTQDVYERGHAGGKIEKVKANMRTIAEANAKIGQRIKIAVNYHRYNDNEHELPLMEEYARNLGLEFFTSLARAISMENAIQYCREHDPESTEFERHPNKPDWNALLPPVYEQWNRTMARLKIPPTNAREMYRHHPMAEVCPVGAGSMFTFIRHDGKTSMCACVADRRITVGDYLDTTPDQMIEQRTGHSICKQCLHYRTNFYFHLVDREKWE